MPPLSNLAPGGPIVHRRNLGAFQGALSAAAENLIKYWQNPLTRGGRIYGPFPISACGWRTSGLRMSVAGAG
jgi:hypothetical protein